jgi:hypothetical protein
MQCYALRDDQWTKIKDFLPGRDGHVGGTAPDNRLFVGAVVYRYRTGIPWRDLPARYGDWKAPHRRFRRWCEGACLHAFSALWRSMPMPSSCPSTRPVCVLINTVPAPPKKAGEEQAIGRSRPCEVWLRHNAG